MDEENLKKELTNTYYLVPRRDQNGKTIGWSVKRGNAKRVTKTTKTKAEAEEVVRKLAAKKDAHVVIYKMDGSVQRRYKLDSNSKK